MTKLSAPRTKGEQDLRWALAITGIPIVRLAAVTGICIDDLRRLVYGLTTPTEAEAQALQGALGVSAERWFQKPGVESVETRNMLRFVLRGRL